MQLVWHGAGITARELADRAGHAKPSESLDTYSHVMPLDEVPIEAFRALLARPGVAQVWPGDVSAEVSGTPITLG